jgi:glycosyltransferase involved in cell wall biosynthesis
MKVSVLINNYNYARYLSEAIESVVAQSFAAHEIIVVDDGSSDNSLEVLRGLEETIPNLHIHSQENGGQLSAMRSGIHLATGDWCCFLDADDTWEPTHLETAAQTLLCELDLGVYYSGHKESSGPPVFRSKWPHGSVGPCAGLVAARGTRIGTITSALCLKREFALIAVDLDESFDVEWRTRADDCLVFGASIAGAIFHYNPIPTVNYRIHGGNTFADRIQDHYMVYRYDLRKWRLILRYCHKAGVRRDELFRLILWEYRNFSQNREHCYCRSKFLQALRRTPAPAGLKLKTWIRIITGKYR